MRVNERKHYKKERAFSECARFKPSFFFFFSGRKFLCNIQLELMLSFFPSIMAPIIMRKAFSHPSTSLDVKKIDWVARSSEAQSVKM